MLKPDLPGEENGIFTHHTGSFYMLLFIKQQMVEAAGGNLIYLLMMEQIVHL
jgi:hypothetical protein